MPTHRMLSGWFAAWAKAKRGTKQRQGGRLGPQYQRWGALGHAKACPSYVCQGWKALVHANSRQGAGWEFTATMASIVSFLLSTCPSAMMTSTWYCPVSLTIEMALFITGAKFVGPLRGAGGMVEATGVSVVERGSARAARMKCLVARYMPSACLLVDAHSVCGTSKCAQECEGGEGCGGGTGCNLIWILPATVRRTRYRENGSGESSKGMVRGEEVGSIQEAGKWAT